MRAMILGAGRGERLRPLTDSCPKPLIEAGERSLIAWHIEHLKAAGIVDIVVNTAWLDHMIHDALGDGSSMGVNIQYSDEGEALETAGGIIKALPLLGDEPFIVVNGDIWCDVDLGSLAQRTLDGDAHIVLVENPEHNPDGDFGIEAGKLVNSAADMFTFSGTGLYSQTLFAGLAEGKRPLAPLLREAADEGRITAELHRGEWTDVGTVERLESLRAKLSSRT